MRLRSLIPALAFLALAACDSTGALKIAQAPAAKTADCCCKAPSVATSCPPPATPIAAQPTAMTPEPERVVYRTAPSQPAVRRETVRRVAHVQRDYGQREQIREYAYAQQRSYEAAPAYDGYADVPDRRVQGQVVIVEDQGAQSYSQQSESYSSGARRYAGGYEERGGYEQRGGYDRRSGGRGCDCGPREAAGRDRNGFLTWPGKVPARP